jgi:hypothetical protein
VLKVGKDAAGFEQIENLAVERALAFMLEVVDCKRRDDGVEAAERGERFSEVVLHKPDALVAREPLVCIEHERLPVTSREVRLCLGLRACHLSASHVC